MRKILFFTSLLLYGTIINADEIPSFVIKQHESGARNEQSMQFTFIGSLDSISKETYRNIDGEFYGMKINIEKILLGSYDEDTVEIGIAERNNPPLLQGQKYYITVGWGNHGMYIGGISELE